MRKDFYTNIYKLWKFVYAVMKAHKNRRLLAPGKFPEHSKETNKKKFIEWNNYVLASSIKKIDANIVLVVILDLLFYLLSGYLFLFWIQRVQEKIASFDIPADIAALGYQRAQQLVNETKAFYFLIIFSLILLLIAIIFLASIFKGAIWAKTTNTKITFRLISKFLALNLIWMGFWFVVVFLISYLVEPSLVPKFMIAAIILNLYFMNTLYTLFMKKQSLKCIIGAIKLNVVKLKLFILPFAIFFVLFLIINFLSIPTKLSQVTFYVLAKLYGFVGIGIPALIQPEHVPAEIQIVLTLSMLLNPLVLLLFTFFRYYFSTLVLEAEKL